MLIVYIAILFIGFYLLSFISDSYFVPSLEKISERLKLSSEVTGATFMAIGSSAPELFTSLFAVFTIFGGGGNANIGSGTIVGSAIFNILVIIGLSLIFTPKNRKLHWQPIIRDLSFYSATIILLIISFSDGFITFSESVMLVGLYILYIYAVANWSKRLKYDVDALPHDTQDDKDDDKDDESTKDTTQNNFEKIMEKIFSYIIPDPEKKYRGAFVVSILIIAFLSHQIVQYAVEISLLLSIPKAIIGLTVLAAGTSIPDAISSVIVAKKGKINMSFTNALGSNIFDILVGLGAIYFVYFLIYGIDTKIAIDNHNLNSSIFLLFATVLLILATLVLKRWKSNKNIGYFLVIVYAIYLSYTIYSVL